MKPRSSCQPKPLLSGLMMVSLLAGCQTQLEPVRYSPGFQAFARADGRSELVPAACLEPAVPDRFGTDEDTYVPLLAQGCATNLTLLQMVEQRSDLIRGRETGPTMAAPVGRAAQVYIEGYDREELRRRLAEQQAKTDKQEAQ